MEYTISYSWQSDSDRTINRDFIGTALEEAVAAIRQGAQVEDFPRIDSGMENQSGSQEIATIMFKKIRDSAIFVGDMTLVGTIPPRGRGAPKRVPNPNVSIEMGYAAGRIGYERIIGVMNANKGRPEELPIDYRNKRFPITYRLDLPDQADASEVKAQLAKELKEAIEEVIECEYLAVDDTIRMSIASPSFTPPAICQPSTCLVLGRSRSAAHRGLTLSCWHKLFPVCWT